MGEARRKLKEARWVRSAGVFISVDVHQGQGPVHKGAPLPAGFRRAYLNTTK